MGPGEARTRFEAGTLIGRYEVIRRLGQGGMGEVYLARDTRLGRRVALKFLLKVGEQDRELFLVEARATARLTHESIVALHDIAEHQGLPYMVLEYVQGKTLSTWLQERAEGNPHRMGLSPVRAAELMLPVARALACAHEAGIVHRDLKLSNLMLADSGTVKVLDFGIAKLLEDAAPRSLGRRSLPPSSGRDPPAGAPAPAAGIDPRPLSSDTETDSLVGTQAYMAPEQWRSAEVNGRTDLWAVGIMLYQLVTGEHPLAPLSFETLVSVMKFDEPMPSVLERVPEIGRLGAVIDWCLIKSIDDRLASARELCAELEAIARPEASRGPGGEEENPYAGLSSLKEGDAARFFGRDGEVEQVVLRLAEQPLLAIVGSSGAGKSSLMRAGVIPALKRSGDAWDAFVLRPGPHPLAAFAELLLQHSWQRWSESAPSGRRSDPPIDLHDRDAVARHLREEPGFLGVELRAYARRRREHILLFVDQFEEIVTLAAEDERDAFVDCLLGAADDASAPLRVVVSVRQDFLDRVAGHRQELAALMIRGAVLVGPMRPQSLRSALVNPAEMLQHRFESEALVSEMLGALAGTAGALPLLQFTAAKLWEGRDRSLRLLTEQSYRAFGGVSGALASHADSVLAGMSPAERRWARVLLLRLVTPERTRAVVTYRELSELGGAGLAPGQAARGVTAGELGRVLGRLIDARLLTVAGAGMDESTVELVHESLIDSWPALSRWLEEERGNAQFRARLRGVAREWEASGRAEGLLWRGEAAEEAMAWRKRLGQDAWVELHALEEQYLGAVVELHGRELRRRRRAVVGVIAGLCLVVLAVSAAAVQSNRERAQALRSATSARNATRLAVARERQEDPTTVLALLREMEPGSSPRGSVELARWARDVGVATLVLRHDSPVRAAAWSPDGRRIVTASLDNKVRVWSADGSGEPVVLQGHDDTIVMATWSPDGKRVVSASWDRTARVWNADGSGQPLVLRGHEDRVFAATWSPDGKHIVSASEDKTVRVWNADGSGQPLVLRGHEGVVQAAAWSPDGRHIVSGSYDKTVRLWTADGSRGARGAPRTRLLRLWIGVEPPTASASSPPPLDKTVRVWSADGSGQPLVLRGHDSAVYGVAFSPDGKRIVSASWDKTALVWGTPTAPASSPARCGARRSRLHGVLQPGRAATSSPRRSTRPRGSGTATAPACPSCSGGTRIASTGRRGSPDGKRIASASDDKTVRVWNAGGTGDPVVLRGHEDLTFSVAWTPDGKRVVSASLDKTVRVWNADGSGQPLVLRGHETGLWAATVSPDGKRIATASLGQDGAPVERRAAPGESRSCSGATPPPSTWRCGAPTASASRLGVGRSHAAAYGTPTAPASPWCSGATRRASSGPCGPRTASASSPRPSTRRCGCGTPTARASPSCSEDTTRSPSCATGP